MSNFVSSSTAHYLLCVLPENRHFSSPQWCNYLTVNTNKWVEMKPLFVCSFIAAVEGRRSHTCFSVCINPDFGPDWHDNNHTVAADLTAAHPWCEYLVPPYLKSVSVECEDHWGFQALTPQTRQLSQSSIVQFWWGLANCSFLFGFFLNHLCSSFQCLVCMLAA